MNFPRNPNISRSNREFSQQKSFHFVFACCFLSFVGSLLAVDKIEGGGRAGNSPQAKPKAGGVYIDMFMTMVPCDRKPHSL